MTGILQPENITPEELRLKLNHLNSVLSASGYDSILLQSEGAMRWLTGMKHQLGDIAPLAVSPVNALVKANDGKYSITIISKPFEMPRLKVEIPLLLDLIPEVEYDFAESIPACGNRTLSVESEDYQALLERVIRTVIGGMTGNVFAKLDWLSNMTMKVLADTARQLNVGMNGMEVQGLMAYNLGKCGIDSNLRLVALPGQNDFLHPVASVKYQVEADKWLKLVVGSRYAELIVSQTLMVKLGGEVTEREQLIYHALQDAAVEYAGCYRAEAVEKKIYGKMIERFKAVEEKHRLKGFAGSATLHHPGGGTSPLGNRDWMLNPEGNRKYQPWTQFAINPVDALAGFKVELQGIVQDSGSPFILNMSKYTDIEFRKIESAEGTSAELPELFIV